MRVTVIVATFNSAKYLREALHSVTSILSRGLSEALVIDGGSTDDTLAVAKEVLAGFPFVIRRQVSKGLYPALNEAISYVRSSHVMFVHSDDRVLEYPFLPPELGENEALIGSVCVMDAEGRVRFRRLPLHNFPASWYKHYPFVFHPNAIYPTAWLRRFPFDQEKFGREADMFQVAEMVAAGLRFRRCKELVYGFRIHEVSTTVKAVKAGARFGLRFWLLRFYIFMFYENARCRRVVGRLLGRRVWS